MTMIAADLTRALMAQAFRAYILKDGLVVIKRDIAETKQKNKIWSRFHMPTLSDSQGVLNHLVSLPIGPEKATRMMAITSVTERRGD